MKNSTLLPHLRLAPGVLLAAIAAFFCAASARAWDYEGHRAINLAALSAMPADFPAFLKTPAARERIGYLAGEPDRWRNSVDPSFRHISEGDHYFDMEDLAPLGMKFADLPQFRYIFIEQLARAQAAHPEIAPKLPPEKDTYATGSFPGFLPWAIAENYGKLRSAFSCLRALGQNGGTPAEIANVRENIGYIMGVMGHYVGDSAQPLHLTKHHHGWVGDNPNNYTTSGGFHSWIDGGFLAKTGPIDIAALGQRLKPGRDISTAPKNLDLAGRAPIFVQALAFIEAQYAKVEPLYALEKAGKFDANASGAKEGRAFLENQLASAAQFLADLWYTAYTTAPDDRYLINVLKQRQAARASAK